MYWLAVEEKPTELVTLNGPRGTLLRDAALPWRNIKSCCLETEIMLEFFRFFHLHPFIHPWIKISRRIFGILCGMPAWLKNCEHHFHLSSKNWRNNSHICTQCSSLYTVVAHSCVTQIGWWTSIGHLLIYWTSFPYHEMSRVRVQPDPSFNWMPRWQINPLSQVQNHWNINSSGENHWEIKLSWENGKLSHYLKKNDWQKVYAENVHSQLLYFFFSEKTPN